MIKRHCGSYLFAVFNIGFYLFLRLRHWWDCTIVLITLPWIHETVLLCYLCFISVYFCDFYSHGIPLPMVTYTRRELFDCNNVAVSGGKLPQPLFEAIKDNGICAVTRGCRAGRNCNRQRTIHPVIGYRPSFRPTFHQLGVNNNNIIHVKLSTCQIDGNDCYTNMALINARSVKNKTLAINEEIIQHDWDILAITETWLKQTGDEAIVTELLRPGYTFHHVARSRGRGGGVAVMYQNTYNTKILPKLHFTTIELIRLQFTNPFLLKYNLWVVYHPPATSKTSGTLSDFYSELEQLFIKASISIIPSVIVGDFNIHSRSSPNHFALYLKRTT